MPSLALWPLAHVQLPDGIVFMCGTCTGRLTAIGTNVGGNQRHRRELVAMLGGDDLPHRERGF
jgi:hypothetical protein